MYQSSADFQEERRRRRLYLVFAIGMGITAVICSVLGFAVLAPATPLVRLGPESRFDTARERPVDVAVKQLSTSKLIPNRPTLSEDLVFVIRDAGTFRAFLGTDPSSGCFITWRAAEEVFTDNCAQHSYGFTGRNTNQLSINGSRPVNMVELPVTVRNGVVFVEDRILKRDIR